MTTQYENFDFSSQVSSPLSSQDQHYQQQYEVVIKNKKKVFNCLLPGCGKTFHFKSEIKRHLVIHSSTRPYVCDFPGCGKSFKRADALNNHSRLHGTDDPFHCPVPGCLSLFNTKAGLQYHLLKHGEEKVFKCDFPGCDKSFITLVQLKQHQKSSSYHKKLGEVSSSSPSSKAQAVQEELISTSDEMIHMEEEGIDNNYQNFAQFEESKFIDFESEPSEIYQECNFEMSNQANLMPYWEFNQIPAQNVQAEIPALIEKPEVPVELQNMKMDGNIMSMLNQILRENQQLKEQLQQTKDLLQPKPVEKPQEIDNIDIDRFFQFSPNLREYKKMSQCTFDYAFYGNY